MLGSQYLQSGGRIRQKLRRRFNVNPLRRSSARRHVLSGNRYALGIAAQGGPKKSARHTGFVGGGEAADATLIERVGMNGIEPEDWLLILAVLAMPAVAIVAFRCSSIAWVRRIWWIPLTQLFLMLALIFIDEQCEGGFKFPWINCGYKFLDQYANSIAGLLVVNMMSIASLLPVALVALAITEVISRKP